MGDGDRATWHHDLSMPWENSHQMSGDIFFDGRRRMLKELEMRDGENMFNPPHFIEARLDPWFTERADKIRWNSSRRKKKKK